MNIRYTQFYQMDILAASQKPTKMCINRMALWILMTLLALQDHAAFAVCGGNYAGTQSGNISTPNYPQSYPDSSNCIWIIHCPYHHYVTVSIPTISIEHDKTCAFDYLVFFDGSSTGSARIPPTKGGIRLTDSTVCGELTGLTWRSTGNSITAKFVSDDSTSKKGFSGTWRCKLDKNAITSTTRGATRTTPLVSSQDSTVTRHSKDKPSTIRGSTDSSNTPSRTVTTISPISGVTWPDGRTTKQRTGISRTAVSSTDKPIYPKVYCHREAFKSIGWQKTIAGGLSKQFCPAGSTGYATRKCIAIDTTMAKWSNFVDTSGCISIWVRQIETEVKDPNTPAGKSTKTIAEKTSTEILYGGDLIKVTAQLRDLTEKALTTDLKNPGKNVITNLNNDFMKVGNNLLDTNAWAGVKKKRRSKLVAELMKRLEDAALAMIKAQSELPSNKQIFLNSITPNIVSSSRVIDVNGNDNVSLISEELRLNATQENTDWKAIGQVSIPRKTIRDVGAGRKKCFAACIIARNAGKFFSPEKSEDENAVRKSQSQFVNTFVTGLALSPRPRRPFPEPVSIVAKSLTHMNPEKSDAKCSYWETNSSNPSWSQTGLVTVSVSVTETVCHTNHFTNFAVLMRVGTGKFNTRHAFALKIITQVGIGISLLCLILAFSIFVNCRSLASVRNTIHKNLCVSLALAYVVFVVGISRTENQIVCTIFATLLYYFLLVAFLWMLMEGIQLYILLVQIFPRGEGFKKQYYVICWGFPAILSIILCSSNPSAFGNETFCWLSAKDHFHWAFVVPVLIIISVNIVFLAFTFKKIFRNSSIMSRDQEMRRSIDKIGYWAKGSMGLVPLLGITWLFGVMYINDDTVIMAYLFTFCNAFQGMYIFLFYCVLNDKVKEDFRRRFCAISRSTSHSFTNASKKSARGSAPLSLSAINFPWNQRRGTQTAQDVIIVHDPTIVRNGTSSTGTSGKTNGTFSKRYQDVIREDATAPDDEAAALQGYTINNGNEHIEYRMSLQSTESRDSGSDLMSPDSTHIGITCSNNGHVMHNSIKKSPPIEEDELDSIRDGENLHSCSDGENHDDDGDDDDDDDDLRESMRDAADEFEERVMRAIERNIRRTISENDIALDIYDNDTVLV